ncbi:MAG: exo-alpha-sialidase [Proteobacteria bacterium]|nr:exo-alpha-sialidase [Pseudomonadota bacterium]
MAKRIVLCIGTKKGLFVAESSSSRERFKLHGPFGSGVSVYSALVDPRGTPRIYASSCNAFFGMKVLCSTDLGKTFKETKSAPAFPKDDGRALANIWSLAAGDDKKELWCGVEPAALFHSSDGGDSWEMVSGISNHDHARKWHPGNGGLCMHTIVRDGNRMHLGISTGGHYLSEDGGQTFAASNKGVGAGFSPDPYPEFGQCVHKIARHKDAPGRLYMQNHGGWSEWSGPGGPRPGIGVLRSDDHGKSWRSIAAGLPSDFGFPIVVHPHNPDVVYVAPLEPMTRTCPGGAPAIWRSENGGNSWRKLTKGLPKKKSYFTILRDGMDVDELKSPSLYFGTTTGQLWIGRDGGEQWDCLFDSLPPIHCVKVAVV